MFNAIRCAATGHRINRREVWNDGFDFRTRCSRCGSELIRLDLRWYKYKPSRDDDPRRNSRRLTGKVKLAADALARRDAPA